MDCGRNEEWARYFTYKYLTQNSKKTQFLPKSSSWSSVPVSAAKGSFPVYFTNLQQIILGHVYMFIILKHLLPLQYQHNCIFFLPDRVSETLIIVSFHCTTKQSAFGWWTQKEEPAGSLTVSSFPIR